MCLSIFWECDIFCAFDANGASPSLCLIDIQLPEDIEWHFVGHLQSNKAKTLLSLTFIPIFNSIELGV